MSVLLRKDESREAVEKVLKIFKRVKVFILSFLFPVFVVILTFLIQNRNLCCHISIKKYLINMYRITVTAINYDNNSNSVKSLLSAELDYTRFLALKSVPPKYRE